LVDIVLLWMRLSLDFSDAMSSIAFSKFLDSQDLAIMLRKTAQDVRLRPIKWDVKQKYYHASLTASVAGWDNYVKSVVREFYRSLSNPLDQRYAFAHSLAGDMSEKVLSRLNTPDRDQARNAILLCTGYDPINDWTWRKAQMSATDVKEFLADIFRVRHSYAHGFALPSTAWTRTPTGKVQLSSISLARVEAFLRHLAKRTDNGLRGHAKTVTQGLIVW